MAEINGVATTAVMVIRTRNVRKKKCKKCEDSSTVDNKNSENNENYVVDSITADCKSCCYKL